MWVLDSPKFLYMLILVDIMTGCQKPEKKTKAELELLVKSHGGKIVQNDSGANTVCVGDQSKGPNLTIVMFRYSTSSRDGPCCFHD